MNLPVAICRMCRIGRPTAAEDKMTADEDRKDPKKGKLDTLETVRSVLVIVSPTSRADLLFLRPLHGTGASDCFVVRSRSNAYSGIGNV